MHATGFDWLIDRARDFLCIAILLFRIHHCRFFSSFVRSIIGIKGQRKRVSKINDHPNMQTLLKHNASKSVRNRLCGLLDETRGNYYIIVMHGLN